MGEYIGGFFSSYYILVIITIGLLVLLFKNSYVNKQKEFSTRMIVVLCLFVAFLDYSEGYIGRSEYSAYRPWRLVLSFLCYNLKPYICLCAINLASDRLEKKEKIILLIPIIVNVIIYSISLFDNHVVFWFDSDYNFKRGPLGYTSHIVSGIYLIAVIYETIKSLRITRKRDSILILVCVLFIITAVLLETFDVLKYCVWPTVSIAITFYYFYLFTQVSKHDPLTGVFNRKCYYEDAYKYHDDLTCVIAIDMNGLKYINDNYGHEAGDDALITLSLILVKNIERRKMYVYRKGGDEFNILCWSCSEERVIQAIDRIKKSISETSYSIAIGYQTINSNYNFEKAEICADRNMYKDKAKFYDSHVELKNLKDYKAANQEMEK